MDSSSDRFESFLMDSSASERSRASMEDSLNKDLELKYGRFSHDAQKKKKGALFSDDNDGFSSGDQFEAELSSVLAEDDESRISAAAGEVDAALDALDKSSDISVEIGRGYTDSPPSVSRLLKT